jgi:hypothetical protein
MASATKGDDIVFMKDDIRLPSLATEMHQRIITDGNRTESWHPSLTWRVRLQPEALAPVLRVRGGRFFSYESPPVCVRLDADQHAGQASDAKRIAPFPSRSTRMRKALRGYAKDKKWQSHSYWHHAGPL